MKIAIIAAMSKELALLLPLIKDGSTVKANGMTFHTGNIGSHEVIATECGIGKVNAAIGTLTLIECFHPDIVINTGVAGGTGSGASILDVVIADRVAYHDVWCGPGTIAGQAAGCPSTFDCPLPDEIFKDMDIKRGLVASGDIFISRAEEVKKNPLVISRRDGSRHGVGGDRACLLSERRAVCMHTRHQRYPGKRGQHSPV